MHAPRCVVCVSFLRLNIVVFEYTWDMYGKGVEYAWNMNGTCMENVRDVHGICMEFA